MVIGSVIPLTKDRLVNISRILDLNQKSILFGQILLIRKSHQNKTEYKLMMKVNSLKKYCRYFY